jgi:hypothetical protein
VTSLDIELGLVLERIVDFRHIFLWFPFYRLAKMCEFRIISFKKTIGNAHTHALLTTTRYG